jgi:hypothetical protein
VQEKGKADVRLTLFVFKISLNQGSVPVLFKTTGEPAIFGQTRAAGDLFAHSDTENMGIVLNGMFFKSVYAAVGGFLGGTEVPPT